jgi:hypothetical protein
MGNFPIQGENREINVLEFTDVQIWVHVNLLFDFVLQNTINFEINFNYSSSLLS